MLQSKARENQTEAGAYEFTSLHLVQHHIYLSVVQTVLVNGFKAIAVKTKEAFVFSQDLKSGHRLGKGNFDLTLSGCVFTKNNHVDACPEAFFLLGPLEVR